MIESALHSLLAWLALPDVSLSSVFVVSFLAATWLPLGSEPVLLAVLHNNPSLLWPALLLAGIGNTLGGAFNYWLGLGANKLFSKQQNHRWFGWLQRFGAKTMLLAWMPVIGDPLCTLAGWLKLPFWPCVIYMAIGKFTRYALIIWILLAVPNGFWHRLVQWL
ncbi:MAG: VTT domain-containing protein [Herbaspirillum sp.]